MKGRVYLTTFAEMRRLDQVAIRDRGVPGLALMENAGRGAAEVALGMLPAGRPGKVAVLAGPGNNGGDGYVLARHLSARGHEVRVYLLAAEGKILGDARANLEAWRNIGGALADGAAPGALAARREELADCDLLVDALFGTGLNTEVRTPFREAIELMNGLGLPTLALDLPSGVDGDLGRVLGIAVRATATVTFGFPKRGHYLYPGAAHVGRLTVVDLGIPADVVRENEPRCALLTEEELRHLLPARPRDAHKGTFGHLLLVAGGPGKTGAALLAARAAQRSGVGLTTIAAPREGQRALDAKVVETMTEAVGEELDEAAADRVLALCAGKNALAVGPGLGRGEGATRMLRRILAALPVPAVLDADALSALAGDLAPLRAAPAPLVLTPHPGEMARLAGLSTVEVQADRLGLAERFAREHGVTLVLKGAYSVVAEPSGLSWVNPSGNPGMASGGMGDVLSGIVGALLAQGLAAPDAARLGTYAHGAAGDLARRRVGETALIASDVVDALPELWRTWEAE
jgi:NAD(P)H-hydrate epimerase